MRLLTRRIYRAFPELDRFDDAQCVRFLKAAQGGWLRRTLRGSVVLASFMVLFVAAIVGMTVIAQEAGPRHDPFIGGLRTKLFALLVMVVMITPGPMLALLLRDRLLRRRVRFVLRTRGVCRVCWYSLVGLPVGEGNKVQCPECGATTEVDESLGELVTGEDGRRRFAPDADRDELARRFWTPQRLRTLRRYTLRSSAAIIIAAIIALAGYEVFLRRQASAARAAGGGAAKLTELVRQHQPSAAPDDDAWPFLVRAFERLDTADRDVWKGTAQRLVTSTGKPIDPRFDALYGPAPDLTQPYRGVPPDLEYARGCIDLARQMLAKYESSGVYAQLAEAASRPSAMRPIAMAEGEPLMNLLLPELGPARQLARICAARMQQAFEADDPVAFRQSLEQGLALARIINQQPLLIDAMVGAAIDVLMLEQLEEIMHKSPRTEFLDAMAEALARQPGTTLGPYHARGERIGALDTLAWVFSDPSRARLGPMSPALAQVFGASVRGGRLSTFANNRRQFERHFDDLEAQLKADPHERPPRAPAASNLLLLNLLVPATERAAQSRDRVVLQRRGVVAMIAIERFHRRTGSYPSTLAEIPGDLLTAPPIDPYSGKPLGYRRLESPDAHGRGYILYSVGHDGTDDGGVDAEAERKRSGTLQVGPTDIILNEPARDEQP